MSESNKVKEARENLRLAREEAKLNSPVDIAWIDDNDGCGPRKLQNSVRCF